MKPYARNLSVLASTDMNVGLLVASYYSISDRVTVVQHLRKIGNVVVVEVLLKFGNGRTIKVFARNLCASPKNRLLLYLKPQIL